MVCIKVPSDKKNSISRYDVVVFPCLRLVLLDPKGIVVEHVSDFVVALEIFFAYGLMNSPCIFPVYKYDFYSNGFTSGSLDEYASFVRIFVAR
jgi:hypothetical protein